MTNLVSSALLDWANVRVAPEAFFDGDEDPTTPQGPAFGHGGRFFIGLGWQHDLGLDGAVSGGSWLQSYDMLFTTGIATITNHDYFEDIARLSVVSDFGIAGSFASRTTSDQIDAIGVASLALNTRAGRKAWAAYFETNRSEDGGNAFIEFNGATLGATAIGGLDPYTIQGDGMSMVARFAAGSDAAVHGRTHAIDAYLDIRGNGSWGMNGINFAVYSLQPWDASPSVIPAVPVQVEEFHSAIGMPFAYGLQWFSRNPSAGAGTQAPSVRLWSRVTDPAIRWETYWTDTAFVVADRDSPGQGHVIVNYRSDATVGISLTPGNPSASALIAPQAPSGNANLRLGGLNDGIVVFTGGTAFPGIKVADNDAAAATAGAAVSEMYRTSTGEARIRIA